MNRLRAASRIALVLTIVAARAPAQSAPSPLRMEPCTGADLGAGARCGTMEGWENREAPTGRRIPIHFVVVPATGGGDGKEAIAYFAGGPGQAATDFVGDAARALAG